MIKNIVFDFGQVLVDWNPYYLFEPFFNDHEKCKYFLQHVANSQWYREGDLGAPITQLAEQWGQRYPEFADAFRCFVANFPKTIKSEVPGMYDLISGLKARGYRIWGLSNWNGELFKRIKADYPIFSLMDGMVISGEEHLVKPDLAIYRLLLERYGLLSEECVFIDDRAENIDAALAVGMKGIVFTDAPALAKSLQALL